MDQEKGEVMTMDQIRAKFAWVNLEECNSGNLLLWTPTFFGKFHAYDVRVSAKLKDREEYYPAHLMPKQDIHAQIGCVTVIDVTGATHKIHFDTEIGDKFAYGFFEPEGVVYVIIEQAQCPAPPVSPLNAIG